MIDGKTVAVVVPAFDEEALIEKTITGLPSFVDRIVVVDDASRDATADRARSVADARVEVVVHERNAGVGAAIVTGYKRALAEKIDVTIVVDMLLTGFDSKFLNTLYVDKNLKHHGLIQAFSRTNRVLNATKPYGQILDFRAQRDAGDFCLDLAGIDGGEHAAFRDQLGLGLVDQLVVIDAKEEQADQRQRDHGGEHGKDDEAERRPPL